MTMSEASVEAIGGAVGSIIAVAATYPLTTISTWQSLDHKDEDKAALRLGQQHGHLPSPVREVFQYAESKGWAALFAGLKPCLAATAISQGVYFYLYSAARQAVVSHIASRKNRKGDSQSARNAEIGVMGSILVASFAGCANVLLTSPVWVVATQMLVLQKGASPSCNKTMTALQVTRQLYEESGLFGFWKGLIPGLIMVLNPTLQYVFYEFLTSRLLRTRGANNAAKKRKLTAGDVFVLTGFAKLGSTLCTYPLLLVKSRLQAMNKRTDQAAQYLGVMDAAFKILKTEGLAGFFKGLRIKLIQTVLTAALLMSIKEQVFQGTRLLMLPYTPAATHDSQGKAV